MNFNFDNISRTFEHSDDHVYQTLQKMLREFNSRGILVRFDGECIAATDIVQHWLFEHGINSRIIECELSLINSSAAGGIVWRFIGFNNQNFTRWNSELDTHVVVVTETPTPWLVDISIARTIDGNRPWVIEPLSEGVLDKKFVLSEFNIDQWKLKYHPKRDLRLPGLHTKNLVDRLKETEEIRYSIQITKWIALGGLAFSLFNTIFNIMILILNN